jgi:hypothetical protein
LFNTGIIEDNANVNLNYHIKGDSTFRGGDFMLRIELKKADNYAPEGLNSLPWSSNVSVFLRDDLDDVMAGSSRNVAMVGEFWA